MQRAFTFRYSGKVNVLKTPVGVFLPVTQEEANINPPEVKKYVAIWDTGATHSVITAKVAADLGLKPIGAVEVCHAAGKSTASTYFVNMILPDDMIVAGVRVTEGVLTDHDAIPDHEKCQVLIGMDIISMGDFAVTSGKGRTLLSFRVPSFLETDFVPEAQNHNIRENGNREQRRGFRQQKHRGKR